MTDNTNAKPKNVTISTVLGFFVWGLFYGGGFTKETLVTVIVMCLASWLLVSYVSPSLAIIVNIAGAYLGNKWAKEFNTSISAVDEPRP